MVWMRTKHSILVMDLNDRGMALGKSREILKIFLELVQIIGGLNREIDGESQSLSLDLGQGLSPGGRSLKVEETMISSRL